MQPHERRPYWCLMLDGLACGYIMDSNGQRYIQYFVAEMQGFAGVKHLYTPQKAGHYVQFLENSTILAIPASVMKAAKEQYPEISELLHILKQQSINRLDDHIAILQQPDAFNRYVHFIQKFPQIARRTTTEQQCDFINISRRSLHRAKKRSLRH